MKKWMKISATIQNSKLILVYFMLHPSKMQGEAKNCWEQPFLRFTCSFGPARGPICMKISATIQNSMLNIMYFMLHHFKMQGEARNGKKWHFSVLRARLRALRALDQKSGNAGTWASLFWPLTPNFVKIHPFLLALNAMEPERRLSAYVYAGPVLLNH